MRRLLLALVLLVPACGSSGADEPVVFAAASLTDAFTEIGGARFNFAGSSALVHQLQEGADADVFASADEANMAKVAELVGEPEVFARNTLAIAVKPGNPKGIDGLADLGRDDLAVVLCHPDVPVGAYAREVLDRAGVTVQPASVEVDVKAALSRVRIGDADAAIVYVTDTDDRVDIPEDENVLADYPVAEVRGGDGESFLQRLRSPRGQRILRQHGFLQPE